MRKTVVTVAVGAMALLPATSAAAAPRATYKPPVVNKVNPVVVADPTGTATAVVHASYTCFGGGPTHLYIGVKQGAAIDTGEHSTSDFADSFFSTNWNADGPGLSLNCDGKMHEQGFLLKPDPYFPYKHPNPAPLHTGTVLVQFCMFDSTNTGEEDPNGFAFNYSMKKVVLGS